MFYNYYNNGLLITSLRKRNDNLEQEGNDESPKYTEYASNTGTDRRVHIWLIASQTYFMKYLEKDLGFFRSRIIVLIDMAFQVFGCPWNAGPVRRSSINPIASKIYYCLCLFLFTDFGFLNSITIFFVHYVFWVFGIG